MSGYSGGDLRHLFSPGTTAEPTRDMLRGTADAVGKLMTVRATEMTPRRTGAVARAMQQTPVHRVPNGYASGVENSHWRAGWVEHGVKPHDIEPEDKAAIITPQGPRAGAKHPGHAGAHMVARAVAETDAVWPRVAGPHLSRWQQDIEARAKTHRGIT